MTTNEVSFGRRLTEIAAERPDDADLIVVGRDGVERPVTWREIEARANQIARALQSHGAVKDSIVCLALPTSVEHVLVTNAIWKLGATLLPLRHDQPQWEMDRLLALAEPIVLVSDTHTAACPVLTTTDLAATSTLDAQALPDAISEVINLGASSGSTGQPKLIVTPIRGVIAEDLAAQHTVGDDLAAVVLVVSPLYHVNGFAYLSPRLLEGSKAIVMEKFDAALAVELIERHGVTFTVMVPTMLQRIARLPDIGPDHFRSVKRVVYGGATIPDWVVDRWLELIDPEAFMFTYGSSERLGIVSMSGAEWAEHRGSTGRPADVTVSIRDADGNEMPVGEVGELWMRPTDPDRRLFRYIGMATPAPAADGYLTVGDLARVDADGYVFIADRRTDMIVTGGANVFPAEVEAALSGHPGVIDQVVVGVLDDEWGHRVHAIVQPADPANPPTTDELRAWCKEHLTTYKVPKTYEILDPIPRTPAGKLNRTALGQARSAESPSA